LRAVVKQNQITYAKTGALKALPTNFHQLDGAAKLNAILNVKAPEVLVRSLAPEELYMMVHDIGPSDCTSLLVMATPEQRQTFIDLDCWVGDVLDSEALDSWLDLIQDGSLETLISTLGHMDPELLISYLLSSITHILDRSEEELIAKFQTMYPMLQTPDLEFYLVLSANTEESMPRLQAMLKNLYRYDEDLARTLIISARTGLRTENEELAYRFRIGRLSDLGFPKPDDAHVLYAPIQIDALRAELDKQTPSTNPGPFQVLNYALARAGHHDSFFNECLTSIENVERQVREFALCVNRAVVATQNNACLKDTNALATIGRDVHSTISLGLEYLAKGSVSKGIEILEKAWLIQLFQTGHQITVKRSLYAKELLERGGELYDDAVHTQLLALRSIPHPRLLIDGERKSLTTLDELKQIDAMLDGANQISSTFESAFGFSLARFESHVFQGMDDIDKRFVHFTTLAQTLLAHVALGNEVSFEPLNPEQVDQLIDKRNDLEAVAESLVQQFGDSTKTLLVSAARELTSQLAEFATSTEQNYRFFTGSLLVQLPVVQAAPSE